MNTPPPLPKKPPAAFHHPLGFELYDSLAMDLHAMAYAEPMLQELETLRRHIADIGEAMRTKANNNPDGVKASTLELLGEELLSALPSNAK
jgi:hypothetical protein